MVGEQISEVSLGNKQSVGPNPAVEFVAIPEVALPPEASPDGKFRALAHRCGHCKGNTEAVWTLWTIRLLL